MKSGFFISFLMVVLLMVNPEFGSTQHLLPQQQQQQLYQASNTPSHTATLGQALQQQQLIRALQLQQQQQQQQQPASAQLIRYAGQVAAPVSAAAVAAPAPVAVPSSYGWQVQHAAQQPQPQPQAQQQLLQAQPQPQQQLIQAQPQLQQQLIQAQPQPQLIRYAPAQSVAARQVPVSQGQYIQPQLLAQAQFSAQPRQLVQYASAGGAAAAGPTVAARSIQVTPLQTSIIRPQALASPVAQQQQYAVAPQPAAAAPSPLHRPASVHYASIGENLAGDYKFGYRTGDGNSFREEARLPDGTVQGQYGFVDADGKQRVVKYMAGVGGYQVLNGEGAAPAPQARAAAAPPQVVVPQWAQSQIGVAPSAPQYAQTLAAAPQQQVAAAAPQAWGTHLG